MGLENPIHLMIVLAVVLMVFGAKRLPEMGRSLGDGMRGFKEAIGGQAAAAPMPALIVRPEPEAASPVASAAVLEQGVEVVGESVQHAGSR